MRFTHRLHQARRNAHAVAFAPDAAFEQIIGAQRPADLTRRRPRSLNAIDEDREITPIRPRHKWPSCVIISSVNPSAK